VEGHMYFCENWGSHKCHNEVATLKYAKELHEGESPPIWPVGKELMKLDQICKTCSHSHFVIKERKCPICDSENVQTALLSSLSYGPVSPSRTVYQYKCEDCKRYLFANKELS
jgi:hypothetical protein